MRSEVLSLFIGFCLGLSGEDEGIVEIVGFLEILPLGFIATKLSVVERRTIPGPNVGFGADMVRETIVADVMGMVHTFLRERLGGDGGWMGGYSWLFEYFSVSVFCRKVRVILRERVG